MSRIRVIRTLLAAGIAAASLISHAASAAPLHLDVYNPGDKGIFPVSSEIITGQHDAILVDAQFQRADAYALVQKIKASGKTLTTVYISHSDPDYYFGLDAIQAAFPKAKIIATPETVAAIKASMNGKLAYWGPILKDNAPQHLVLPEPLQGDRLTLEGHTIDIKGLEGPDPARTYLWIPSLKTVAGGVVVNSGDHVWIADTQTRESRDNWLATLQNIEALKPATVVPGHFAGPLPKGLEAVHFTADYLKTFELEAAKANNSAALISAMKAAYPTLAGGDSLELSAKVIKGEMQWPAQAPSTDAKPAADGQQGAGATFPAIGKRVEIAFGETVFQLDFKEDARTMSFIGTAGSFKGVADTVQYTAVELRPQLFMLYWHEPHTGMNVVHIEDFERGVVRTNIAAPDGSMQHMSGTLRITGNA
jgi:glyoxylase-like metal-dependent hydrolase (beta-lactamase superfamily II)